MSAHTRHPTFRMGPKGPAHAARCPAPSQTPAQSPQEGAARWLESHLLSQGSSTCWPPPRCPPPRAFPTALSAELGLQGFPALGGALSQPDLPRPRHSEPCPVLPPPRPRSPSCPGCPGMGLSPWRALSVSWTCWGRSPCGRGGLRQPAGGALWDGQGGRGGQLYAPGQGLRRFPVKVQVTGSCASRGTSELEAELGGGVSRLWGVRQPRGGGSGHGLFLPPVLCPGSPGQAGTELAPQPHRPP